MKTYQFEFEAIENGYGIVSADSTEEAKKKILDGNYDDIMDTWDMTITKIINIEEEE